MANLHKKSIYQRLNHSLSFSFFLISYSFSADSTLQEYASQPRWGQASLLMPDNSLLIYGGKVPVTGGYTYSSSPNTDDVISLSLDSTYSTSSAPWQYLSGSKLSTTPSQLVSYATLGLLVEPTDTNAGLVLSFGGDGSSLSNLSDTDSSWIINLPQSGATNTTTRAIDIQHQPLAWAHQPTRRIRHTLVSASSSTSLRLWVLGGQKSDASGTVLNELWQYAASKTSPLQGSWSQCPPAPSPTYDHASVAILDSSNQVTVYALGGVGSNQQASSMSNIYRFTPKLTSDSCDGSWETLALDVKSAPSSRRGHSIVSLSSTQILLYGGASANGESVYDDLWLLDLSTMKWSQLSSGSSSGPGARWGHAMVRAGNNVIVACGYGALDASHAAPSTIGVYNLQDLKWTNVYTPSLSTNGAQPSKPLQSPDSTHPESEGPNDWQVPGSRNHVQPLPIPTISQQTKDRHSSTSTIVGIILGIMGALVIGVVSLAAYRYRKKAYKEREIEANLYKQRASGPDFDDGNAGIDDDKIRLVNPQDSLHACHTIPRTQVNDARFDQSAASPLKALVGVGVRALWSHKSYGKRKQRFDMLADEESQVWECTESASLSDYDENASKKSFDRTKALKKYADGFAERVRLPPPPPCPMSEVRQNHPCLTSTRSGMRIWNGLEESVESHGRFGTSTSFLGASLAPWSDDGRGASSISEYGMYDSLGNPLSNRQSRRVSASFSSAEQPSSWETSSRHDPFADPYCYDVGHIREGTGYSTVEDCDSPDERNLNYITTDPFDDMETVDAMKPLTSSQSNLSLMSTVGNPLLNGFLPSKALERQGTWWDRLRYGSDKHAVDLTPGAVHPIRDPTPAPPIPPINRSDAADVSSQLEGLQVGKSDYASDEHGRCRKASNALAGQDSAAINNLTHTSQSSNQTASTATSSMIEAATSQMVVIQRFSSRDSSLLTDSSYNEQHRNSSHTYTPPDSIVTTVEEQESETRHLSLQSTESRPLSPRPMGPRTLSPIISNHDSILGIVNLAPTPDQTTPKRPPAARRQTAGSVGVRAMVKKFEAPSMTHSESQDSNGNLVSRRLKVERSLAKKPLLFVANPDK